VCVCVCVCVCVGVCVVCKHFLCLLASFSGLQKARYRHDLRFTVNPYCWCPSELLLLALFFFPAYRRIGQHLYISQSVSETSINNGVSKGRKYVFKYRKYCC